jgi:hypothetical protein
MAATSLRATLATDFPALGFIDDTLFFWSSSDHTIHIGPPQPHHNLLILHELGHAVLQHTDYRLDIELLQLEVAAWNRARELAAHYHVPYRQSFIERHLDTYRNWLAHRSTCPHCHQTGYQTVNQIYHCPSCFTRWRTRINRMLI